MKLKSILQTILLLNLGLIPILGATQRFGFEHIKVLTLLFLTSVGLGLFLLASALSKERLKFTRVQKLSIGLILILLLTSFLGTDIQASILGKYPYFQGWITYLFLLIFSLLVGWVKIPLSKWAGAISISAVIVGLVSIIQYYQLEVLNQFVPTYAGRVVSTFGQPNFYSGFLLFSLPLVWGLGIWGSASWRMGKLGRWGVLGVSIIGILISWSKTSIFLMVGLIVWLLVSKLKNQKNIWGFSLAILFLAILLLAGIFSLSFFEQEVIQPHQQVWLINNSPEKRVLIWPMLLTQAGRNVIWGYGLENIQMVFSNYDPGEVPYPPEYFGLKNLTIDRSHNYPLDLLLFSGILGLLGWLILVFEIAKKLYGSPLFLSLIAYLVFVQFQNQSIVHLMFFWWLVGISSNMDHLDTNK